MKKRLWMFLFLFAFSAAYAADKKVEAPAAMAPDAKAQEEMMKKFEEAGKVTDQHKALDYLQGEWNTTTTFWAAPNAKPEESKGKSKFAQVFEGRFLQESFDGNWMGKPFHGIGYLGYDNMKKKYTTTWMDNMSTGVVTFEGESSDKGKTITSSGEFMCPMTGKPKSVRATMKKVSKNEVRYEHYDKDTSGKEFKTMEVVYKR